MVPPCLQLPDKENKRREGRRKAGGDSCAVKRSQPPEDALLYDSNDIWGPVPKIILLFSNLEAFLSVALYFWKYWTIGHV